MPEDFAQDLITLGGDLRPATLELAYCQGMFPMPVPISNHEVDQGCPHPPEGTQDHVLGWWSPLHRGVLPLVNHTVSRSLRRSLRRYRCTVDAAFDQVVAGCADPRRPHGWITQEIALAYHHLHQQGLAHSVECWDEHDHLAGGLYGVALAGLFAGESMFSLQSDASKVALAHLVRLLSDDHAPQRLLDVQWVTPHLASLGCVEISRAEYLLRLRQALTLPLPSAFARS